MYELSFLKLSLSNCNKIKREKSAFLYLCLIKTAFLNLVFNCADKTDSLSRDSGYFKGRKCLRKGLAVNCGFCGFGSNC